MCAPESFRQAQSPSDKLRTAPVEARGVVRRFLLPFDQLRAQASVSSPVPTLGRMASADEVTEEVA